MYVHLPLYVLRTHVCTYGPPYGPPLVQPSVHPIALTHVQNPSTTATKLT